MKSEWKQVSIEHVQLACKQFEEKDIPLNRRSRSVFLHLNGNKYSAKFIRGLAYKIATGLDADPDEYSGGLDTIRFFDQLGLEARYDSGETPKSISWEKATLDAIASHTLTNGRNTFTRQELIDDKLDQIIIRTGSAGLTPDQTLSRVLQELRDDGFIEFLDDGVYQLISSQHIPICADLQNEEIHPSRISTTISRIVRDTKAVGELKRLYGFRCQLCGTRLEFHNGCYCEAHHIRPLGMPHNGSDGPSNLIIVCPNHHVLLDYGAISIPIDPNSYHRLLHKINPEYLEYHNSKIFKGKSK